MLSWLAHKPRGPEAAQTMYCCLSFLCNSKLASQSCLLYSVLASTETISFYLHPLTIYKLENKYGCNFHLLDLKSDGKMKFTLIVL